MPSVLSRLANVNGSVVSRLNHQCGCRAPSRNVRSESAGGMVSPLRMSRRRPPPTAVSTVSTSVSYPAASARATKSFAGARSRHTYSWNQRRAPGAAAATSSIVVVPIVDSAYGIPTCSATVATARSPVWCIIRVKPVGPNANGIAERLPRISRLRSTVDTSRSTEGWNSTRR